MPRVTSAPSTIHPMGYPPRTLPARISGRRGSWPGWRRESAARHAARTAEIEELATAGDDVGAKAIVDSMWPDTYATLSAVARVEAAWNELAARVDGG